MSNGTVPFRLRQAALEDWPGIQALLSEYRLPLAGAREHIDTFIVAEGDRLIGCIGLELHGAAGLVRSLAVDPAIRGTGIGRVLVNACLEQATDHGLEQLILLTETTASFWARFGFTPVDRAALPVALQGSAELQGACPASAVAMSRNLVPQPGRSSQ